MERYSGFPRSLIAADPVEDVSRLEASDLWGWVKERLEQQIGGGVTIGGELGRGIYGPAFQLSDGRVLKITTSSEEYEATKKIQKVSQDPSNPLVRIDQVDVLRDEDGNVADLGSRPNLFFSVMGKAPGKSINDLMEESFSENNMSWFHDVDNLRMFLSMMTVNLARGYPRDVMEGQIYGIVFPEILKKALPRALPDKDKIADEAIRAWEKPKQLSSRNQGVWDFLLYLDCLMTSAFDAIEVLERSGIEHGDAHVGNIFFDPSTGLSTLIDFSRCNVKGKNASKSDGLPSKSFVTACLEFYSE